MTPNVKAQTYIRSKCQESSPWVPSIDNALVSKRSGTTCLNAYLTGSLRSLPWDETSQCSNSHADVPAIMKAVELVTHEYEERAFCYNRLVGLFWSETKVVYVCSQKGPPKTKWFGMTRTYGTTAANLHVRCPKTHRDRNLFFRLHPREIPASKSFLHTQNTTV